ncbi:triose-phosphate transporter family domain-containing protein [Trichoderma afarasin]|uniref:Sugar phosphate/phosphate translocator n=1 Tax=Trichoderma lentiforme TaxID=1567552 RepID=A0A9P4XR39_9HYPO|nr:putative sugar phosphate/phosphate translocator [Trichoderma lentiforme]
MTVSNANGGLLPMMEVLPSVKFQIPVWAHIINWMFFSNVTIIFNKWLIDTAGFKYPILLTCWHLIYATIATQILARTTTLLDSRRNFPISGRLYLRTILPIGLLYSGSLICSNVVYLYLSVSFIQMLKAASPVAVLFASWSWGVAEPNLSKFVNVLVIVFGVAVSSFGEIQFSWVGFFFQIGGTCFEAVRVVMIQVMLSGEGLNMDPLVSLYYYAPVCAVMNFLIALVSEIPKFQWEHAVHAGFGMLFLNASIAFILNVASVFLIGKTSGLVMTLTGIFKSILLVVASVLIWSTQITFLQTVGYTIALAGLTYYSLGYDQLVSLGTATLAWTSEFFAANGGAMRSKRLIVVGISSFVAVIVVLELTMSERGRRMLAGPSWHGRHGHGGQGSQ